ncbi:MAG: 3-phosphoshikimate 1-carboxyvinyltransferase [Clostridia bacterium]|nr:3-phosphoshikimate 1-carboxyvinyltransferase [Clostridia bacterium]
MKAVFEKSRAEGCVFAPPSKSVCHRALIAGALSDGSEIKNVAFSKDIEATLSCLRAMGAGVEVSGDAVSCGGLTRGKTRGELDCGESGSTLRFFIPLCLLRDEEITLTGSARLFERPLSVYEDICARQGLLFRREGSRLTVRGKLEPGEYTVPGDISSQFITGLLFALPLLSGDSFIRITGKTESAAYIDLTLAALSSHGVCAQKREDGFFIPGGQKYEPCGAAVEGDCSNAAFLEAFNETGGSVCVRGISPATLQGDRVYKELFDKIKNKDFPIDISGCPDLGPVLFAVAAARGEGYFTGTRRLKIKESDRAEAMREELSKLGADVTVKDNDAYIKCGGLRRPATPLSGHNDHRIVMALSVICAETGGEIEGAEAVSKSFPDFFEKIKSVGVKVELI